MELCVVENESMPKIGVGMLSVGDKSTLSAVTRDTNMFRGLVDCRKVHLQFTAFTPNFGFFYIVPILQAVAWYFTDKKLLSGFA